MKKKFLQQEPPTVEELGTAQANALIQELWAKLRDYEDKLAANSKNTSKSPSTDSPEAKAERKKLKRLVAETRLALNLVTRGIDEL